MKKIRSFLLTNTHTRQTVAKNTIWLFIGEIGARLIKMFVFVYAARKLGVTEWGVFSYVLAIVGFVSVLSDIGINAVLTREISRQGGEEDRYIATSFSLKLILSILGALILLSLTIFTKHTQAVQALLPLSAIMLFLDSIREFGFALNRAYQKMEVEAITKIISNMLLIIIVYILINRAPTAVSLSWGYIGAGIFGVISMYVTLRTHFTNIRSRVHTKLLWPLFTEAWPIAAVAFFGQTLLNIDTVLLGLFKNLHEVGLYGAAQKPIQLLYLIPSLVSTALLPVFSRLSKTDTHKMQTAMNQSLTFALGISIPIAVGGILLGKSIILALFGTAFSEASGVFGIMVLSVLFGTPSSIIVSALFAHGKQRKILQYIALGAAVNTVLCLILIPRFGMYGAAISMTLAQCISNAGMIMYARKIRTVGKLGLWRISIAALLMGGLILMLRNYFSLLVTIPCGIVAYGALLFIMKEPLLMDIRKAFSST